MGANASGSEGAKDGERERGGEKPFMIKTARSQSDKLGDDTSHSTTKGENIGWGPFTEKLMRLSLKELSPKDNTSAQLPKHTRIRTLHWRWSWH